MTEYLHRTFFPMFEEFQSLFRVIPVDLFLKYFASDRRHMLTRSVNAQVDPESGESLVVNLTYISPLPTWPAIRGILATTENNLMEKYVQMGEYTEGEESVENTDGRYGSVHTLAQLVSMTAEI